MSTSHALCPAVAEPTLFIAGEWVPSSSGARRATINPVDNSVIQHVSEASVGDAERAVSSARAFFNTHVWSDHTRTTFGARCESLERIATLLQQHKDELARVETIDTGKTLEESKVDVDDVTTVFRFYAQEARKLDQPKQVKHDAIPESANSVISHEPVGVCVLITPWNYPILQVCWKLAPALAAGNPVIIKPSEVTPLSTIYLVRKILLDASVGIPAGAIQLLTASGATIGDALTTHADVDLVSFTGGLATGTRIIASCAAGVKRCCVELGGKNPHVVFADVAGAQAERSGMGLDWAADIVATACFLHSGQVCSSGARLIVDESIADALVAKVVDKARNVRMGDGLDPASETGPLVSAEHARKIQAFVELGKKEGAKLLVGGSPPDPRRFPHLAKGCFFLPTVFDHCDRSMQLVQAETFGPILTVERFRAGDEATALALANDTRYGLAGGVLSADVARARRFAAKLRHGTVWINTYGSYTAAAEWGGFGMSGNGRELGCKGLEEYIETKHTWHETKPAPFAWFKSRL
ncbi:putative aldehyde dehydrogenase [Tilletiaria anomala UBC 951]|uniref:Putative aldehyde dehydrogenase n=1 Tax=Tilletiaria anomala (strain ATCC 24038 / CBS 436.72 / UBC 951) TaxID=1037660 RepID=A0A066WKG2_TILAU|nr:putative aldehyde dehydrogenase [Tilletiaria anomala UBC 951]KDN53063.1 putative aldehyde dehydrogenase [Tilletiaria anomala UBC 951]